MAGIVLAILLLRVIAADAADTAKTADDRGKSLQVDEAHALRSYADVRALLDDFMKLNKGHIGYSVHGAFWNEMSYREFIEGNVPGVSDRATGKPLKILVIGNSRESNIIMALRGHVGSPFDRDTGSIGRMPPTGPYMHENDMNRLADWIDRGCPDVPQ
jgi:hypothetical protein